MDSCQCPIVPLETRTLVQSMLILLYLVVVSVAERLKVTIYTESQCKDTIALYQTSIKELIESPHLKEFLKHVDIEFIPFGNGQERLNYDGSYKFTCQHGDVECYGNTIEACALDLIPRIERQSEFLVCLHAEKKKSKEEYDYDTAVCLREQPCLHSKVKQCVGDKLGNYLLHRNAKRTLAKKVYSVPWIEVNENHEWEDEFAIKDSFLKWLCFAKRDSNISYCTQ